MSDDAGDRRGGWIRRNGGFLAAVLVATALLLAAYSNHFKNGFHFDDRHVIVDNAAIRSLHDVSRFFKDPTTFTSRPQNASYRPLLTTSFALDYRLGDGLDPAVFHRTQFTLLLLLGVLLVPFYRRLADQGLPSRWNRYIALFAATWFCVHTANTETVNYISSRSSLIATLGVVASFLIYLGWPKGRRTLLYLVPVLVGGLAKPLTVIFAPLLVAHDLLIEQQCSLPELLRPRNGSRIGWAVLRGAPALLLGGGLFVFLRMMEPAALQYATVGRFQYLISQPLVWLHYFRLFLWPSGLTADSDWKFLESWKDPRLFYGSLFLLALVAAIVALSLSRRLRPAAFGLVWFALALLPTSSIFPLSEVYNEHRIFFPYVGLTFAVVWTAWITLGALRPAEAARPLGKVAVLGVIALAVLTGHAVATHQRNEVWKNDLSLWEDVARKSPRNGRGLMNYGLALMSRGRLEEAHELFEQAVEFTPNYPILEVNLGIVTAALGSNDEAERHFKRALQLDPQYGRGYHYYATWLLKQGRATEAIHQLERAVAITPWSLDSRVLLMRLFAVARLERKLDRLVASTLELAPSDPTALAFSKGELPFKPDDSTAQGFSALGRTRLDQKLWLDAALLNRKALELDPNSAIAWNNLGWALGNLGFYGRAVPCFRKAYELDPEMTVARANLAWAQRGATGDRNSR